MGAPLLTVDHKCNHERNMNLPEHFGGQAKIKTVGFSWRIIAETESVSQQIRGDKFFGCTQYNPLGLPLKGKNNT